MEKGKRIAGVKTKPYERGKRLVWTLSALKKSNNQKRPINNDSKKTNEAQQKQLQTLNRKQSRRNKSRSVSPAAI